MFYNVGSNPAKIKIDSMPEIIIGILEERNRGGELGGGFTYI
jgi:hypothetical protein